MIPSLRKSASSARFLSTQTRKHLSNAMFSLSSSSSSLPSFAHSLTSRTHTATQTLTSQFSYCSSNPYSSYSTSSSTSSSILTSPDSSVRVSSKLPPIFDRVMGVSSRSFTSFLFNFGETLFDDR